MKFNNACYQQCAVGDNIYKLFIRNHLNQEQNNPTCYNDENCLGRINGCIAACKSCLMHCESHYIQCYYKNCHNRMQQCADALTQLLIQINFIIFDYTKEDCLNTSHAALILCEQSIDACEQCIRNQA